MPQLRLKLTLDKRLSFGNQKRRYKRLVKRFQKQLDYAHAQQVERDTRASFKPATSTLSDTLS